MEERQAYQLNHCMWYKLDIYLTLGHYGHISPLIVKISLRLGPQLIFPTGDIRPYHPGRYPTHTL